MTTTEFNASWNAPDPLQIGRGHTADGGWGEYFHGGVDTLRVFGGALTASQTKSSAYLYRGPREHPPDVPGPLGTPARVHDLVANPAGNAFRQPPRRFSSVDQARPRNSSTTSTRFAAAVLSAAALLGPRTSCEADPHLLRFTADIEPITYEHPGCEEPPASEGGHGAFAEVRILARSRL
ncbi:hypothetical protein ACIA6T_34500 [Streptomyces sp. NPDC051740]|uniref:hypothetical protein n=1 Tax=Streptomyces sp. NPDC051740 TaxID=3365673 RepID=UPI0037AAE795